MPPRRLFLSLLGFALAVLAGCPDKSPKDPACDRDEDCKAGQRCINKLCVECGADSDCPDGQTCQNGACVAANKVDECSTDQECAEGQVCKNGACLPCESNDECGPGGKCQSGTCLRPRACRIDEDCEDDEDCIDGRCLKPWKRDPPANVSCKVRTVFFDFDQWTVRDDARETLSAVADCLQKVPRDRGVYVVGHADDSGTEEYNVALSERRARAVADYLARLGIDPARLQIVPKGESELSGRGSDADRRVEFEWR